MEIIKRKKLQKTFSKIQNYPLSILCSPLGFGKTTAIENFTKENNIKHIYMNVKAENNLCILWKRIIDALRLQNTQVTSIPDTEEAVNLFYHQAQKSLTEVTWLILDDLTLYQLEELSFFFILYSTHGLSKLKFVLLCEQLPKSLEANHDYPIYKIGLRELCFSNEEIANYFKVNHLRLSESDVKEIEHYTNGWPEVLQRILLSYQHTHTYYNIKNIDKLIKEAYFNILDDEVRQGLIKLSILPEFTLDQALNLCESKALIRYIVNEHRICFIQKKQSGLYLIPDLLREFLNSQLLISSNISKEELYSKAGKWYESKQDVVEAIRIYLENNDFEKIISILEKFEGFLTDIAPGLMLDVLNRTPMEIFYEHPYMHISIIDDVIVNLDVQHGRKLLETFRKDVEKGKYSGDHKHLMGEYYFVHAFTQYNDVFKMMEDFHHAYDLFHGGKSYFANAHMVATFGSCHMLYLYHRERGKLSELVEMIQEEVKYFSYISNGVNSGANYQTKAELAYETGCFTEVKTLADLAYQEASRYLQQSIAICSTFLKARLAYIQNQNSEFDLLIERLHKELTNEKIPIIKSEIECALTYLYLLNNQEKKVPSWVKNENLLSPSLWHEAGMYSYIIMIFYNIKNQAYNKALHLCHILDQAYEEQAHIFGMLYSKIFSAISLYHLGKQNEGVACLVEAATLAKPDHLVSIFIELSPLMKDIMKEAAMTNEFLNEIMNQQEYLVLAKKRNNQLTNKEYEVCLAFGQNKTVAEVSKELVISANTVQTHLKKIYKKLHINSKIELIEYMRKNENK